MTARRSLRWRLTAIYGGLFLAAGGLLLTVNYSLVRHNLPSDKLVFTSSVAGPGGKPLDAATAGQRVSARIEGPPLDAAYGVIVNGQPKSVDFLRDLPERFRARALHSLLVQSLLGLAAVGAVSVGVGWWLAGRALQPLQHITDTARRLSETNLDQRINLQGPHDELRELADTFDAMLGRLDAAFDSQRRFVANASHELRTPLAIMRTQLEVAETPEELESARRVIAQVIHRSERLIDGLLLLARADAPLPAEEVDLADSLRLAIASAPSDGPAIALDGDPRSVPVIGDPALLHHLVRNLVDNACRHNRPGGWVRASCTTRGEHAVLVIANGGARIAPDGVAGLFEPFRRLSADRTRGDTGAGLGLSIVRAVARAHGGDVTATAPPDGGLSVEVVLPLAPALEPASR